MPSTRTDAIYEFGSYRLEVRERRLICEGRLIPLTGKAFETLRVLVERHGSLVSKRELMDAVWPETAVEENNLDRNISALRKALREDADTRRYIETVPRAGYRFIAPLAPASASGDTATAAVAPAAGATPAISLSAIAVLPFADMSPERDQDYLCEGFAEELINALTHVDGLRVASRTASFQFRDPGADVREVGRRLNVGTLLEGSVRKSGQRLRVTVQLIETETGYHRWSKRFDRAPGDLFAIQDEIAESVAASLRGLGECESGPPDSRTRLSGKPKTSAEAYEFYLRGRHYLHLMTQSDLKTSSEMFERAIGLDAGYGPAWGCLAAARATLYEWFGASDEDLQGAELASRRALSVAPHLAEAHAAHGFVLTLSGSYGQAAQAFEDAIRLNPAFYEAYYYFARSCFANGQIERSAELFRKAADVRQEDFQSCMLLAQSLRMLGQTEEAAGAAREGIQRAERVLALNPVDGRALSLGAGALFHDGQIARAIEWSQRSLQLYPDDVCVLVNAACLQAKLRHKEEALELLQRVFAKGWGKRDWIDHDPDYDLLRDDPRFQDMLAKLK